MKTRKEKNAAGRGKEFLVASCGLVPSGRLAADALEGLRACGEVFSTSLDPTTEELVRKAGVPVRAVRKSYPALLRDIAAAFSRHGRVGLLVYGNPFFLNHPLGPLLKAVAGFARVRVLPGVSSADALIGLFGMSDLSSGLLCLDLNYFREGAPLFTGAETFFFCPDRLNRPGGAALRAAFSKSLAAACPPERPVFAVKCGAAPEDSEIVEGSVASLPRLIKLCGPQHTLVLLSEERTRLLASGRLRPACGITPLRAARRRGA